MKGQIIHAPLQQPSKILEVGSGTGIVTRQLGRDFPNATVYGVDISPVPPSSATPGNVSYIQGDIKKLVGSDERLEEGSTDYIFERLLVCGMTDWPAYVQQLARLLRPGGYLECHEMLYAWYKDGRVISDDWKWMKAMHRGGAQLGLDIHVATNVKKYMEDAGLIDVKVAKYEVPYGPWMAKERPETKRTGEEQAKMGPLISQSILPGVTRKLGISDDEMTGLKEECRQSLVLEDGKYWPFYVTWGRKP